MANIRIAILGGSSVWTPEFLTLLGRSLGSRLTDVVLQGKNIEHTESVAQFSNLLINEPLRISVTTDIEKAVSIADIVINQVRIGGWRERANDELFPVQWGFIGDETLGLGGLRSALRTLPFVKKTARLVAQRDPQPWLINLTNPTDLLSRTWRSYGLNKVIGACDNPQKWMKLIGGLNLSTEIIQCFGYCGTNHLGWIIPPSPSEFMRSIVTSDDKTWLEKYSAVPTPWRKYAECTVDTLKAQRNAPCRAKYLEELADKLRQIIRDKDADSYKQFIGERYPQWYPEVVVPLIEAIVGIKRKRLVLGLPNGGRLPEMPSEVQLETWTACSCGNLKPEMFPAGEFYRNDVSRFAKARDLAFQFIQGNKKQLFEIAECDPFLGPSHFSQPLIDWIEAARSL